MIAYQFFYYVRKVKKILGYSITRPGKPAELLWTSYTNTSRKGIAAMAVLNLAAVLPRNEITEHRQEPEQNKTVPHTDYTIPNLTPVLVW